MNFVWLISTTLVGPLVFLAWGLPFTALDALAAPPSPCKSSPKLVGACFVIYGRATYGNGTPALRIWPVGTKRMLGVTDDKIADDADDPIVPKKLAFDPFKKAFGSFEVCPFTPKRKGVMQMVCVETARNLSIR